MTKMRSFGLIVPDFPAQATSSECTMNSLTAEIAPPTIIVDYNAICLMLCLTVLLVVWMVTRTPRETPVHHDRVLCFLSLTNCAKTVIQADTVNNLVSRLLGSDVVIAGAFPRGSSGAIQFASHDGRPIPHSTTLRSNIEKLDMNSFKTLKDLRAILRYPQNGTAIRVATVEEVRSFKATTRSKTWSHVGIEHNKVPVFFTIRGLEMSILIMGIQFPGCRAHDNAPTKINQI